MRAFRSTRQRLLFWTCTCFFALALNNVILFVDKVVTPDVDLSLWRNLPALLGAMALIYGLIWEAE